ncbi:MAG: LPS-assembly protein LptD [Rhodospirillales bacterium]|nr:LPS-assembly protein LptD [Rhodospirillales bacterium]
MPTPPIIRVICAVFGVVAVVLAAAVPESAGAQPKPDLPSMISADEVTSDEEFGIVTATGKVEVTQGEMLLKSDSLSYNRRSGVITATGNVGLVDADGTVVFSDFLELTGDFRDGIAQNFRALMADQSRFAAVTARRSDGTRTVMRRATYSPCQPCADNPTRAPIWQIRAERITHDQAEKEVTYKNAWIEFGGVPVAYTPYMSHPDGSEKRKSGFLMPDVSSSSQVGTMVGVPYYWVIGPSADATITPIALSNDYPMLTGEYRERARNGQIEYRGAFMNTRREGEGFGDHRGYISGRGNFDIDNDWRWGFDGSRATDKTFIDRYRLRQRFAFLDQNVLESRLYTEGFRDRGFAALNAFSYQGLRPEDSMSTAPLVLPAAEYSWYGEPGASGGRFAFEANSASIYRSQGLRAQRGSMVASWLLPYTTNSGEVYSLGASVQGDLFHASRIGSTTREFRPEEDGTNARVMPEVSIGWRYPLVRQMPSGRMLVEPIAAVYVAPNMGNQAYLPNEDSLGFTFDDTNLFRRNRFSGFDRLESGVRSVYGANTEYSNVYGQRFSVFLGQQFRTRTESAASAGSGIDSRFSDFVGRINAAPHTWVSATYRFQVDSANRELLRSVSSMSLGPAALRYSLSHVRIDRALQPTAQASINQLGHAVTAVVSEYWRFQGRVIQQLGADDGILVAGGTLIYEDDCFVWGLDLTRRNIGRAEIPPDTALLFRIALKNLGELSLRGF